MNRKPMELTQKEWQEVYNMEIIKMSWGLEKEDTLEDFKQMVYAVKFNYMNESPGYVGDFYIIMGAAMVLPLFLTRDKNNKLEVAELDD